MGPPKKEKARMDGGPSQNSDTNSLPRNVLLVNSGELADRLTLPDTLVLFADTERLGDALYRDEIVAKCGYGPMVYAPLDLYPKYRGDSLAGLGNLGARLTSIPMTVADIEKNPAGLPVILEAKDKQVEADDAEFNRLLQEMQEAEKQAVEVEAPPLDGLLDSISTFISSYVFFSKKAQLWAVTLWVFHTHVIDQFEVTPYLHIKSPEKGSGKTRVFEVLAAPLVKNAWQAINPSEAVFYRKIEAHNPTMLLDEVDAIWNYKTASQHEGLRAGTNAGYRRGVTVDRCAGPRGDQLRAFPVFCAKALAGIGALPDTVADRCIIIDMVRKTKNEKVRRFRRRDVQPEAQVLYADIVACASELEFSHMPDYCEDRLRDRAEEVWEPLIWIADKAGGQWPSRAREAALSLSADIEPDDDSLGVRLLADCRTVFEASDADRLSSKDLFDHLHAMEESPWSEYLTIRKLASLLKKYGVRPKQFRLEDKKTRGYIRDGFIDAWTRYTSKTAFEAVHLVQPGDRAENGAFQSGTKAVAVPDKNSGKPGDRADVPLVPDETPYTGAGDEKDEPELEQAILEEVIEY